VKKFFVLLLVPLAVSHAVTVYLDFGNNAMDPATGWNSIGSTGGDYFSIVDSNGGALSGVSAHSDAWLNSLSGSDFAGLAWDESAVDDFDLVSESSSTFTISGLSSASLYQIEIVASHTAEFRQIKTSAIVNSLVADRSNSGITDENELSHWTYHSDDWLIWDGVSLDGNGDLTVTISNVDVQYGIINAMKITETPEPATLALMGMGALMLRKSRKA
jgi:hypothetical protein